MTLSSVGGRLFAGDTILKSKNKKIAVV